MRRLARGSLARAAALLAAALLALAPGDVAAQDDPHAAPEALVRHLYDVVTFPAGADRLDYEALRAAFLPEAVIVLRTSRTGSTVMSVDDFLADWRRFIAEYGIEATGFREEVTGLVPLVFGDIAHVLVLYESSIPGRMQPREGVDSFHLVRRDGRWWIAGILNEIPSPERPVPAVLREAAGG